MTNEELAAEVARLRAEVERRQSMIQELSQTVDTQRRDVAFAQKRCEDLTALLEAQINRVDAQVSRVDGIAGGRS
jgi:hypothetical protein